MVTAHAQYELLARLLTACVLDNKRFLGPATADVCGLWNVNVEDADPQQDRTLGLDLHLHQNIQPVPALDSWRPPKYNCEAPCLTFKRK